MKTYRSYLIRMVRGSKEVLELMVGGLNITMVDLYKYTGRERSRGLAEQLELGDRVCLGTREMGCFSRELRTTASNN